MNSRGQVLRAVGGLLGALVMLAAPSVAAAAKTIAGTTLTYKETFDGQRTTQVVR